MSALEELADFVLRYCDERPETARSQCRRAVDSILTASLPFLDRQAVLYGYADQVGATREPEFKTEWKPLGCH